MDEHGQDYEAPTCNARKSPLCFSFNIIQFRGMKKQSFGVRGGRCLEPKDGALWNAMVRIAFCTRKNSKVNVRQLLGRVITRENFPLKTLSHF